MKEKTDRPTLKDLEATKKSQGRHVKHEPAKIALQSDPPRILFGKVIRPPTAVMGAK